MGACNSCNALDVDEIMFADANYTPHYTLLSDPIQERKTSSNVSVPIIKRKAVKRASTTFVQTMNVLGPVLRQMTSEDHGEGLSTASLPRSSESALSKENAGFTSTQPHTHGGVHLQPERDFPLVESGEESVKAEQVTGWEDVYMCPLNHEMRRFSRQNLPDKYSRGTGVPRCDECGKSNIHRTYYYRCSQCDHDLCWQCISKNKLDTSPKQETPGFSLKRNKALEIQRFREELLRAKQRVSETKDHLKVEEVEILEEFEQNNHIYLTASRQRAFMFLSKAFEVGYKFERSILEDIYNFYSQRSGDINDTQMNRLLTELNKSFAQICADAINEAQSHKNSEYPQDTVTSSFIEELQDSYEIYTANASNISTKQAKRTRRKFHVLEYGDLVTLEAFCDYIGQALFEEQMNMTEKWNRVLHVETPDEFLKALSLVE